MQSWRSHCCLHSFCCPLKGQEDLYEPTSLRTMEINTVSREAVEQNRSPVQVFQQPHEPMQHFVDNSLALKEELWAESWAVTVFVMDGDGAVDLGFHLCFHFSLVHSMTMSALIHFPLTPVHSMLKMPIMEGRIQAYLEIWGMQNTENLI